MKHTLPCGYPVAMAGVLLAGLLCSPPLLAQSIEKPRQTTGDRGEGSDSDRKAERDDVRGREEWFYRQRQYPLARIPGNARAKALEHKEGMRRAFEERARGAAAGPSSQSRKKQADALAASAMASSTAWTTAGPMPTVFSGGGGRMVSGRVTAIAVDPTNAQIVYVGGAQGGIWKSTDGGQHWIPTFDTEKTLAMGAIAIDPASCAPGPCTTLYAGTGEQNFSGDSYYGAGVYKSTDGGMTWTQIPGETILNPQPGAPNSFLPPAAPFNQVVGGVRISTIVVHPQAPQRLFASVQIFENVGGGASSGIYCSEDGGSTWQQIIGGAIGTDVAIHPGGVIGYAALGSDNGDPAAAGGHAGDNGIYKSTNVNAACSSQTWSLVSTAPVPQGTAAGTIRLGLAPSDPAAKTLYAAVATPQTGGSVFNTALAGVFKTTDGGATWSNVYPVGTLPDFCTPQCAYDLALRVHPSDANTVIVGGARTFNGGQAFFLVRTNDGGNTWTPIAQDSSGTLLHVDQHAIAFSQAGTTVYVGNDGGIWSSPLATPSSAVLWANLNATLSLSQFYPGMSFDPTTASVGFGGTQDNGTQKTDSAANPANEWVEQAPCGDGGYTAIDPASPGTIYAACQHIAIRKSLDGGADGFPFNADAGINQNDRVEFIPPLVIDPNTATSNRLYFGTFRVWQTMNGGASWSAISPDLTAGNGATLTSLSVSPVSSDVVYAGTFDSKLWRTTNASAGSAATWTRIDGGTLPPRAITQVAADPNHQDLVFVTVSGFSGFMINPGVADTQGHVFACVATSLTCTDISGTGMGALPNIPANAIVVDPIDPLSETLYIGTDVGVFATVTGGATWQPDFPAAPPASNGLPNVAVLSLTLQTADRLLRAGTHGRGAWDLQLSSTGPLRLASLAPTSAPVNTVGLVLTLNGSGFTANSTVLFNNVPHPVATLQSSMQMTVNLTAADLATVGTANVKVMNPIGDTTSTLMFTITNDFSFCVGVSAGMACPTTGSASIPRGVALITSLTVIPVQNAPFPANVQFSCSGLPNESSCNFTSTAVGFTPGPTGILPAADGTMGSAQVAVSFMTMMPSQVGPGARGPRGPVFAHPVVVVACDMLIVALGVMLAVARRQRRARRYVLAVTLVMALAGLAGACGNNNSTQVIHNPGTTPGTYPIAITATSGNAVHSVTYTLTVQ